VTAGSAAMKDAGASPDIFLVAGEASGDELGAALMDAIRARAPNAVLRGVGGDAMGRRGLQSLFPLADIAVMGFLPVIRRLPQLLSRIRTTADEILARAPDVVVIIDSPDFTHRVARRVRARNPAISIVDYVSPSVWAWRPGRARRMRAYVDHVMALLPFEPDAHARLGGPPCTYVGHPLIERLPELRGGRTADEPDASRPTLLVLPGSRRSEIRRHMPLFAATVERLGPSAPGLRSVLAAAPGRLDEVRALAAHWPGPLQIVTGEDDRFAAFSRARVALAASGTVTLELALAGLPMVIAYKVSAFEAAIARRLIRASHIGLPNIVLGETLVPELLQESATPQALAAALAGLVGEGGERAAQLAGFARIEEAMRLDAGLRPSEVAADIVLAHVRAPSS